MGVDMIQAGKYLEQDALHASAVHALMIACFHQLVQIPIHILHAYVKFLAQRIKEDIESRNKMRMCRQRSQEDDFSEFKAWSK